jgi:hypothetical protein
LLNILLKLTNFQKIINKNKIIKKNIEQNIEMNKKIKIKIIIKIELIKIKIKNFTVTGYWEVYFPTFEENAERKRIYEIFEKYGNFRL